MSILKAEESDKNYISQNPDSSVGARFALYELADIPMDTDITAALGARMLEGAKSVLDIGTADGLFLLKLASMNHEGFRVGLERNHTQLSHPRTQFTSELREYTQRYGDIAPFSKVAGDVRQLPFTDSSIDVISAFYMLYHLPVGNRGASIKEIKRVLQPNGVFVLSTSGEDNKRHHREIEAEIASELDIKPPKTMNAGFTTEYAMGLLPWYFRNVFVCEQSADMLLTSEEDVQKYGRSILSLRDMFDYGSNDPDQLKPAFLHILGQKLDVIRQNIATDTRVDHISRSIFIATDDDLFTPDNSALQTGSLQGQTTVFAAVDVPKDPRFKPHELV